jgi:Tfp pilus assembly protein PilX
MTPRCCITALALALAALPGAAVQQTAAKDGEIRLAQATTTTTPSVTPVTPNSTSATCLSGCSTQSLSCQNTCIATVNGTTVIPSVTTVGVTIDPNRCVSNCSSQQQQCQRNCALEQ